MAVLRYVSHPNVVIDPDVLVPRWGLSELGRSRAAALGQQPWISTVERLVASDETKAQETAKIIASHLVGEPSTLEIETRPETGETDRSSTGFVPQAHHDELARRYFAEPEVSAEGWERSIDSQRRIVAATADLVTTTNTVDTVVVGHGGVGTLLLCHLAELEIDQRHDQPGQGHYWAYDIPTAKILHRWRPVDDIEHTEQ